MQVTTVCLFGGSGFVGRHICHQLAAQGYRARVPTRDRERAKQLLLLPTVELIEADVHDSREVARAVRGADAVINLVGVLHAGRGRQSFAQAHVELARKIIAACREAGVRRYVHMSALNADPGGRSAYLRSKGEAEAIVRASSLEVTVFRPSVIFGPEDGFLNLFATMVRLLPVIALGSPGARFQPVFVEDVAAAFVRSLEDVKSFGKSFDLCGPKIYALRELVEYVGRMIGYPRPIIGLNDTLSYWQAYAMEWLPVKLLTRDNYYSMKFDNVCHCEFPFGIRPAALEAVAPGGWYGERRARATIVTVTGPAAEAR
jgi:NADH dehydrogenase